MIDGHGFVLDQPAAVKLAQSRTNSGNNRGKGHPFLDHLERTLVVLFPDQSDIFFNINARGTGPLTWCRAFIFRILPHDPPTDRCQPNDIFRTDIFTGSAARTLFLIYFGKVVLPDRKGAELTGGNTGTQTQASNTADFHPTQKHGSGTTVLYPLIYIIKIGVFIAVMTAGSGEFRFLVR